MDDRRVANLPGASSKFPDAFLIVFGIAVLAYLATFVLSPGQYEISKETGRIVSGTYVAATQPSPAPLLGDESRTGLLDALFAGLISGDRHTPVVSLSALLLIIGGTFGMLARTQTIDQIIEASLPNGRAQSEALVLAIYVISSLCGATFGMSAETIALTLILAPALTKAGYDGFTAIFACFVGSQIGFSSSWMNPFTVLLAQSIAGVEPGSGIAFRIAMWAAFTSLGAVFLFRHARATRRATLVRVDDGIDLAEHRPVTTGEAASLRWPHVLIAAVLIAGLFWVGWGVAVAGYYFAEMSAQFFAIGLVVALLARLAKFDGCDWNSLMDAYREGAAQMLPAVFVVAGTKGIILLLGGDGPGELSLLNAVLHSLTMVTAMVPEWVTAISMLGVQSVLNVFVVSGSGQASLTMPIMAPLADLSGVTRETAIIAFQLGDGLTNLLVPTSPILFGCLAAAKMNYGEWLKLIWKPMLALMILAAITVAIAHQANL